MSITATAADGIHQAEALLDNAANRLGGQTLPGGGATDVVSLSDTALALIQARIAVSADVGAFHAALEIEKALIDVVA